MARSHNQYCPTLFFVICLLLLNSNSAQAKLYKVKPPAPNWCKYAKLYLVPTSRRPPINCSKPNTVARCIKINNYGCVWQVGHNDKYEGTDIVAGKDGAHDGQGAKQEPVPNASGHAVFIHPKWSISAKLIWFYNRSKGKSAVELARKYMDWCEVLGSHNSLGGWHRSCKVAQKPGVKYCQEPSGGKPLPGQCKYCNCPDIQAAKWVKGTGRSIHDPLVLFEKDGSPKPFMIKIVRRNSLNEIDGYKFTDELLKEGIETFKEWRVRNSD